jgi:hypothetical protein
MAGLVASVYRISLADGDVEIPASVLSASCPLFGPDGGDLDLTAREPKAVRFILQWIMMRHLKGADISWDKVDLIKIIPEAAFLGCESFISALTKQVDTVLGQSFNLELFIQAERYLIPPEHAWRFLSNRFGPRKRKLEDVRGLGQYVSKRTVEDILSMLRES